MGIRSILRRAVKPAAMAVVAGTLALSLTVTTTQKAEASPIAVAPVILAAEGIVGGASIPLAMPSLLAASIALHPVGWAIGAGVAVAGLAIGAYHTRDYWLPYVTGTFGGGTPPGEPEDSPWTSAYKDPLLQSTGATIVKDANGMNYGVTGSWKWSGSITSTASINYGPMVRCKNKTNGNTYAYESGASSQQNSMTESTRTKTRSVYCPAGYEMVGYLIAGRNSGNPSLPGPTSGVMVNFSGHSSGKAPGNVIMWGDMRQALGMSESGSFDPKGSDVKYKTTVECISDDGTKSTITADFTGDQGGAKFPSCAAAGKGHGTGKNKIEGYAPTAPGQPGTIPETLWETTAPATDPNYEKCDQGRPGSGCRMAITIDGKPCVVGQWECENWTELYRDDATKPRVGCTYGPYTLSPDACSIMEPAYRPGGAPTTEANVDGNPQTRNNNELNGQPYTPQQAPTAPGGAGTLPAGSSPEAGQCFPSGWAALNPVEWVMKPVGCALDAAFKPKKDVQVRVTSMQSQFANKVPISWFSTGTEGVTGGSCPTDWAVTVHGERYSLICGTPADDIVQAFRPVMGVMLVIAALWPLIRSLFYSAIPVFKVTPS